MRVIVPLLLSFFFTVGVSQIPDPQIPQENYDNYAKAYLNWVKYLYPDLIGPVDSQPYHFVPFHYNPTNPDAQVPVDEGSGGGPPTNIEPRQKRSIILRMIRKK